MRFIGNVCVVVLTVVAVSLTSPTVDAQEREPDRRDDRRQLEEPQQRMGRGRRRGQRRGGRQNSDPNALVVGEMAPEFTLKSLDGSSTTELSQFRGDKPVVLFFGSYT